MIFRLWDRLVVRHPVISLAALGVIAGLCSLQLPAWRLDASSDSLMLENDPHRRLYDETRQIFGSDEYIILATEPAEPWSRETTTVLDALTDELEALDTVDLEDGRSAPGIDRVISPTNQRLFRSLDDKTPPLFAAMQPMTLMSERVSLGKARDELTTSELFSGTLVSRDGHAFAIVAYLAADETASGDSRETGETVAEAGRRGRVERRDAERERRATIVKRARTLSKEISTERVTFHTSGIPAIVVDMLHAVRGDIVTFGWLAATLMVLMLLATLRAVRWVVLPMTTVALVVTIVLATSVVIDKPATVVTANLSSLLVIVGMAHAIHIAVHYRETRRARPDLDVREAVRASVSGIARPCLYAALTTTVGFASVAVSDIRPVIDFGLLMAFGALIAYAVTFGLVPAAMSLLPHETPERAARETGGARLTALARWSLRHDRAVLLLAAVAALLAIVGISRLRVETRFTDYFRADSPISRGLDFIDRKMGGTTPLEVVLSGDRPGFFLEDEAYEKLEAIHDHLASLPEIGSVKSLVSLRREGEKIAGVMFPSVNVGGLPLSQLVTLSESVLGQRELRRLIADYAAADFSVVRCVARVRESSPSLGRRALVSDLERFVGEDGRLEGLSARVTGVFVLYANMLESLVSSQIQTGLAVSAALLVMLWALFRRLRIALIGLATNLVPVAAVLGVMGWWSVPLDMMTIMIASVSLGLAVDATIHYVFRYQEERRAGRSVEEALVASHGSIGRAVLYTAMTVIGGFWVLVFSNFKPSIHFGVMTSFAVAASLASSLTLLPVLLRRFAR